MWDRDTPAEPPEKKVSKTDLNVKILYLDRTGLYKMHIIGTIYSN